MRFKNWKQQFITIWDCEPRLMKVIFGLVVLNLLLLLVMNHLLSPEILATERQLIRLQTEVRTLGSGGAPVSPQALYQKAGQDLESVKKLIPGREKLSGLLLDLYKLADQAGFTIERVAYDPDKLEELNLLSYSLSFTVTGSYRQIKNFVHLLENSRRIVILDSINLVEAQGRNKISMRLKMTTYFQQEEA